MSARVLTPCGDARRAEDKSSKPATPPPVFRTPSRRPPPRKRVATPFRAKAASCEDLRAIVRDQPPPPPPMPFSVSVRGEASRRRGAALTVLRTLALHAWRRRRGEAAALGAATQELSQRLARSRVQRAVCKDLLEAEMARVGELGQQRRRAEADLQQERAVAAALRRDKATLQEEAAALEAALGRREGRLRVLEELATTRAAQVRELERLLEQRRGDDEQLRALEERVARLLEEPPPAQGQCWKLPEAALLLVARGLAYALLPQPQLTSL